jgi:hypothetical protein
MPRQSSSVRICWLNAGYVTNSHAAEVQLLGQHGKQAELMDAQLMTSLHARQRGRTICMSRPTKWPSRRSKTALMADHCSGLMIGSHCPPPLSSRRNAARSSSRAVRGEAAEALTGYLDDAALLRGMAERARRCQVSAS